MTTSAGEGEAKVAGVDKVRGHASNLAPRVDCEASFIDKSCENFEREENLIANVGDEAGEAINTACWVKVLDSGV